MTPMQLAEAVRATTRAALSGLGLDPAMIPEATGIERPRNPDHGDYASTIAMQLARSAGIPARRLAQAISARLVELPGVAGVDVAGPGFLNTSAGK